MSESIMGLSSGLIVPNQDRSAQMTLHPIMSEARHASGAWFQEPHGRLRGTSIGVDEAGGQTDSVRFQQVLFT